MAPSSRPAKRGGRRQRPSSLVYRHITYNRETGIFTINVLGHTRTATSDALALWERDQMFKEYAPERACVVCGTMFKPDRSLGQRICSDACTAVQITGRQRARLRRVLYVERYLYRREATWIAEPYDAHVGVRLKETFQTEAEAREFIEVVMNSTRPWRVRRCKECAREFDWWEESLNSKATTCRSCGGPQYKYNPRGWVRKKPLLSSCRICGGQIESNSPRPRVYCDDCLPPDTTVALVACLKCGKPFQRPFPTKMNCSDCDSRQQAAAVSLPRPSGA